MLTYFIIAGGHIDAVWEKQVVSTVQFLEKSFKTYKSIVFSNFVTSAVHFLTVTSVHCMMTLASLPMRKE